MVDQMFDGLAQELCDSASAYYSWWRNKYGNETIYAFGFFTPPCVEFAGIVVFSEEGLRRVASEYKSKEMYAEESIESLMHSLRWSPGDSPHCSENVEIFSAVNARLASISEITHSLDPMKPEFGDHMDLIFRSLVSALCLFREIALSGSREPLLSTWFGDQSEEEFDYFLTNCNDMEMIEWYRRNIDG